MSQKIECVPQSINVYLVETEQACVNVKGQGTRRTVSVLFFRTACPAIGASCICRPDARIRLSWG